MADLNGYDLTRNWFAFAFENTSQVRPVHGCLYLWLVELCNRRGWASEFQAPAAECMLACGISNYRTYKSALDDLVKWGFIDMRLASKNQYTANVIALVFFTKAPTKAIDKALQEHLPKQVQSTGQSIDSYIKQETEKQETEKKESASAFSFSGSDEPPVNPKRPNHAPTWQIVRGYFEQIGGGEYARAFFDHHEANGWVNNKGQPIQYWQSKASGWISTAIEKAKKAPPGKSARAAPSGSTYVLKREDFYTEADWQDHLRKKSSQ